MPRSRGTGPRSPRTCRAGTARRDRIDGNPTGRQLGSEVKEERGATPVASLK